MFGYFDDFMVVTNWFQEHLKWLELVLRKIIDAGLVVTLKKCEFCCSEVQYLGNLLDKNVLRPDPEKVALILKISPLNDLKGVRFFLGVIN